MARYDPYDRGDNPLRLDIDRIDMPKSKPAAKSGGGRPAPTKTAKKKKPAERYASSGEGLDQPLPRLALGPAAQPSEGPFPPSAIPPRVTGPESTAKLNIALPDVPDIPASTDISSGLLAPTPPVGPGLGSFLRSQLFNQGQPVNDGAMRPERSTPMTSGFVPAGTPPGGPVVTPPPQPQMPIMQPELWNFLRSQLFNQGRPVS